LLTLIVLGESVLAVVLGVSKISWDAGSAAAASTGFIVAAVALVDLLRLSRRGCADGARASSAV
jgi:hypothetical protein